MKMLTRLTKSVGALLCALAGLMALSAGFHPTTTLPARLTDASGCPTQGVLLAHADGAVTVETPGGISCSNVTYDGSMYGTALNKPIVGIASVPGGNGYWLAASDGGVFSFGSAVYHGSTGNLKLNAPIVGIASTPDGGGYWLVASDGGVFTFGDARYYGSMGGVKLNKPIVGMAVTPDGGGYWLAGADGGVFSFGDAGFVANGSLPALGITPAGSGLPHSLNAPIRFISGSPDGGGYRMIGGDGGVFDFGDAQYYGSAALTVGTEWEALAPTDDNGGYWLFSNSAGGTSVTLASYGDAPSNLASSAGILDPSPIVGATLEFTGSGPAITTQPADVVVTPGSVATFSAAASGTPAPSVQWYVSIDHGSTYTPITNATSDTLSFTTVQSESGGLYRAVFTNASGQATTTAALLSAGTPEITGQPADQSVTNGSTATFSASAIGDPTPTVQWYVSTDSGSTWSAVSGATSTTLTFTTTSSENGTEYDAEFTNSYGTTTTDAATLTVM
ncbi:MAG TPA: immunoglobulin domain-containing protein [Acidimicrobiales bacterium]|nr:immunoglobulin domain-containing protein [Acidimicrobiales bacterium]